MALGLVALSTLDSGSSTATIAALLVVFGLGFGLVSQVLTVAIQNAVDRRDLGIATASREPVPLARRRGRRRRLRRDLRTARASSSTPRRSRVARRCSSCWCCKRSRCRAGGGGTMSFSPQGPAAQRGVRRARVGRRERRAAALGRPALHTHDFDEAFYVLEGELSSRSRTRWSPSARASSCSRRATSPHTLANHSDAPARYVLVITPAGFERYFARMADESRPSGRCSRSRR